MPSAITDTNTGLIRASQKGNLGKNFTRKTVFTSIYKKEKFNTNIFTRKTIGVKMKKLMSIFLAIMITSGILVGCGPSASDPCDCFNNALKEGDSNFDAQLAKDCNV